MKKVTQELQGKQMLNLLEGMEAELMDSMNPDEAEDLLAILKCHKVLPPDEKKVSTTIEEMGVYLRNSVKPGFNSTPMHTGVLQVIRLAAQYMSKWHVLASVVIFIAAFLFITMEQTSTNPYTLIIALAPIPFILGLVDVIKSFHAGMQELEMSFRTNAWQFMLSKLMIICISNIALNISFTVLFTGIYNGISLWKMTIYWCSPFFLVCSVAIILILRVREYFIQSILIALWTAVMVMLLSEQRLQQWLLNLNIAVYLLVTVIAVLLCVVEIIIFIVRKGKRGEFFDTGNGKRIEAV